MLRKESYTKAMVESIKNAGMWLKEAKLLAKKGFKGHAQALMIFAGEELSKAAYCWFTIIGIFPYNHPEVDFRSKKSVFRSHSLKNATAVGLMMGFLTPNSFPDDEFNPAMIDPFTNTPATMREILGKMGAFATWARSSWMYALQRKRQYAVANAHRCIPTSAGVRLR